MDLGILHYRENFLDNVPRARLRALAAEGLIQGVNVFFLESATFNEKQETVSAFFWSRESNLEKCEIVVPQNVILHGNINTEKDRRLEEWMFANRLVTADKGMTKIRQQEIFSRSALAPFVIPTTTLSKACCIKQITDHSSLYNGSVIKMDTSNRGTGLIFIIRGLKNWKLLSARKILTGNLKDVALQASRLISKRIEYRDYLIQPLIKSCTSDGRGFDIRVHIQKNSHGVFTCTRLYARLADAGSLLPNTSKGGYQIELDKFLDARNKEKAQYLKSEIKKVALLTGEVQDQHSDQPLSELGIDFLIDENDHIHIVESNALPQSKHHELERAENVIGYAKYLYKTYLTEKTKNANDTLQQ